METKIEKSVLKTIAYADLFDYPLTSDEIWHFLISSKIVSKKSVKQYLASYLSSGSTIVFKNGFYCLFGREKISNIRKRREKESIDKLIIARKVARLFSYIFSVDFVGLSGNLAMGNAEKEDDIDLFIITKENTLWITRLLLLFVLEILGLRRKRSGGNVVNKICLNMMIDESKLLIEKSNQDLFSAHEVVQLVPLLDRNNTHRRFILANQWVKKFLANNIEMKKLRNGPARHRLSLQATAGGEIKINNESLLNYLNIHFLNLFEFIARKIQLWYMKRYHTNEIVFKGILAFYPSGYKSKVLRRYNKLLRQYGRI